MVVFDRRGGRIPIRITSAPLRRDDQVVGVFGIAVPLAQTASLERSPLDDLTPRQLEVLRLLAEGLETPQIASRLGVAEETARNHIRALLRATGAHSRLEVVLMGFRSGVLHPQLGYRGHVVEAATADDCPSGQRRTGRRGRNSRTSLQAKPAAVALRGFRGDRHAVALSF